MTRDELIRSGMRIVQYTARKMCGGMSHFIDLRDLIGAGHVGMLGAVQGYDPAVNLDFESYARHRIRGAILDQMRADDHISRYARSMLNRAEGATHELRHRLRREPTENEVAQYAKLPRSADNRGASLGQYELGMQGLRRQRVDPEYLPSVYPAPDARLHAREQLAALAEAMRVLSPRLQHVLRQHYWEGRTQFDIARELGLTESRVCQMLREAAERLRASLGAPNAVLVRPKAVPRGTCEIGEQMGCWTVIARAPARDSHTYALCRCQCGAEREHSIANLRYSRSRSCHQCRRSYAHAEAAE